MRRLALVITVLILVGCSEQSPFQPPVLGVSNIDEVCALIATTPFNGCIHAANTALIACEEIGMRAFKVDLWRGEVGHQVTIAYDEPNEWHLFNVNQYSILYGDDWETSLLEYFNGRYSRMELFKPVLHNQGGIN